MGTTRLTTAQALVGFLAAQRVDDLGTEQPFFAGMFGIFGHGNLAGIGQALQQQEDLRYYQARNEQAMVHAAIAYAKHVNRLQAFACTSSVGPGATNMVTGAATATINRLPVLLLPGDTFASRRPDPVLQQLEHPMSREVTVNDAFRPVSRYFDRIHRPEQLVPAMLDAMRVLTDPAETGAVTICLPQDVQAEAFDWPDEFLEPRTWSCERAWPTGSEIARAAELIRAAHRPVVVVGGGAAYSGATVPLATFLTVTGIPAVETQAGKGTLPGAHPLNLGAVGATGTSAANAVVRDADLVIGIGTRWSDFTTASRTAFANPGVRIVAINVNPADAVKLGATPVIGDAAWALELLWSELGYEVGLDEEAGEIVLPDTPALVDDPFETEVARLRERWSAEVDRLTAVDASRPLPSQAEVIGAVNRETLRIERSGRGATVVCAAGSLPGDLHKLWRTNDPKGYHLEYGYSCMGYEVAGGLGVKLADPEREVFVMVGDGSWLMMSSEIVTAVQEHLKLVVVLIDNHGFGSIGALSESLGSAGFGTRYRHRNGSGRLDGEVLPLDLAATARGMGAHAIACRTIADLEAALADAREVEGRPVVITIETDPTIRVPGYDSWWDVPVAEVSTMPDVQAARATYERERARERWLV